MATPRGPQERPTTKAIRVVIVSKRPHRIMEAVRPLVMNSQPVELEIGVASAARLNQKKIGEASAHRLPSSRGMRRSLEAAATATPGTQRKARPRRATRYVRR